MVAAAAAGLVVASVDGGGSLEVEAAGADPAGTGLAAEHFARIVASAVFALLCFS